MGNKSDLIGILRRQEDWVPASTLARMLQVSTRTIRNYVVAINGGRDEPLILSSYKGYRYNRSAAVIPEPHRSRDDLKPEDRVSLIARRLVSSRGSVNFYDLAEELCVSDATLERDLTKVREALRPFALKVFRESDQILIAGMERQKRKYISHLLSSDQQSVLSVALDEFFEGTVDRYTEFERYARGLLKRFGIYADDYGFRNIVIHLVVTLERVANGESITENVPLSTLRDRKEYEVALCIGEYVRENYGVVLTDAELYYVALTISTNSNLLKYKLITPTNIREYIEEKYILLAKMALRRLEDTFYLEPFDDDFVIQFTIHIRNLIQRALTGSHVKNPLVGKFKTTYPLIYDMAVLVANQLREIEGIHVPDDEIVFIAFHIGAYLEQNKADRGRINTLFVYADYHNMHEPVLTKIQQALDQDLNIVAAVPVREFAFAPYDCQLIISTVPETVVEGLPVVYVNVFPTEADLKVIRRKIEEIRLDMRAASVRDHIQRFAVPALFRRNVYAEDEFAMIRILTQECAHLGLCPPSFEQEVLDREAMSSTAFPNQVAIPHSLQHSATRSFLSIVVNERPMRWGNFDVRIIILIGVCKDDRNTFQEFFSDLVSVLCNEIATRQLIQCDSYEAFLQTLTRFLLDQQFIS
ncbi:BglG family transcription antiterminator [Symbiobacterium thermophilum]|uniref:Transcription antiterminator BglG family n=1 Tax=Symbiobacterium thermophilum (strain DSM 24528 / JCM 14929 / IAM 14863 / T) TaxID=292459 RepID=Q67QV8_SYMTH|nr:PRD domain-containing protein [Symbiobacterium thermophilum]BAD39935.1 transcription antiterminator BglG family [Symbiobacterium thermophilum IAM 14863]